MKTLWTKGLAAEQAAEIKSLYAESSRVRKRLTTLIEEMVDAKDKESMDSSEYEKANWAYKQADAQGFKRAMNEILAILD